MQKLFIACYCVVFLIIFEAELSLTNLLHMRKALTIFGIFISSVSICFGQELGYKLGSYINPDFKRKELDFSFNSAGNFYKTDYDKNNSLNGGVGLNYFVISNSQKEQARTWGYLSGDAGSSSGEYSNFRSASTRLSFTREAFQFFKINKFIEITPNVNVDYNYSKQEEDNHYYGSYNGTDIVEPYYNKDNNLSSTISLKLGIGKGRIEDVGDARQAMFILQELQKKHLLKKTLNNDEVNALTEQITLVKNQRYYDYRIQLMDEISTVDSFLVANDFVDKANSALYFNVLYDKWMYGDRDRREAGSYIKGGIAPEYWFSDYRERTSFVGSTYMETRRSRDINSSYGAALYVDYRYEKPLNLALQSSFNAGVSSGLYKYRNFDDNFYKTRINASYKLGYYPNTRTYVSGSISQSFEWNKSYYREFGFESKENNASMRNTNFLIDGYYFLSPQLRLFGQCNFSLSYINWGSGYTNQDKYPATSFQIGLKYAIF